MPLCSRAVTLQKKIGDPAEGKTRENLPRYFLFLTSVLNVRIRGSNNLAELRMYILFRSCK